MEEDAGSAIAVTEVDLKELAAMAEYQVTLEEEKEHIEKYLKELNEKIQKVSEQDIPNKMFECGMSEFKLTNGRKITVKKFYSAKITEENKPAAFSWLYSNGFADIIKHNITVPLGKGSSEVTDVLTKFLSEQKIAYADEENVHPQTLKSFVKEQVEAGSDLPLETFKVFIGNKSIIK